MAKSRSDREVELAAAAVLFVAPYAELSDEFLRECARDNKRDTLHVIGRFSLTGHGAESILRFRKALRDHGRGPDGA